MNKCVLCNSEIPQKRRKRNGITKYCSNHCCKRTHALKTYIRKPKKLRGTKVKCGWCEKEIYKYPCFLKLMNFCSISCKSKFTIRRHGFKKFKKRESNPYNRIQVKGKRVTEHRYLMQLHLGRSLEKHEHIHHINGNPKDNRIENLQIVTNSEHSRIEEKNKLRNNNSNQQRK